MNKNICTLLAITFAFSSFSCSSTAKFKYTSLPGTEANLDRLTPEEKAFFQENRTYMGRDEWADWIYEDSKEKRDKYIATKMPLIEKKKAAIPKPTPVPTEDLAEPLQILTYEVRHIPKTEEGTDMATYRNRVELKIKVQNLGSKTITAWAVKVLLGTKLGKQIGTVDLTSEASEIRPGQAEFASFTWSDNQLVKNEVYDHLSGVSTENLTMKPLKQKVVKRD